nr:MAG TPA: hypothetical protein [Caudoviricetes sp.]
MPMADDWLSAPVRAGINQLLADETLNDARLCEGVRSLLRRARAAGQHVSSTSRLRLAEVLGQRSLEPERRRALLVLLANAGRGPVPLFELADLARVPAALLTAEVERIYRASQKSGASSRSTLH